MLGGSSCGLSCPNKKARPKSGFLCVNGVTNQSGDLDASIFLIAARSMLHCPTIPYSSAFIATLSPYDGLSGRSGTSMRDVNSAGRFRAGVFTTRYSTGGFCCGAQALNSGIRNRSNSALICCQVTLNLAL